MCPVTAPVLLWLRDETHCNDVMDASRYCPDIVAVAEVRARGSDVMNMSCYRPSVAVADEWGRWQCCVNVSCYCPGVAVAEGRGI